MYSGIRRGQDVFRALRWAPMWSRASSGIVHWRLGCNLGAQSVLEYLREHLYIVIAARRQREHPFDHAHHVSPARIRLNADHPTLQHGEGSCA